MSKTRQGLSTSRASKADRGNNNIPSMIRNEEDNTEENKNVIVDSEENQNEETNNSNSINSVESLRKRGFDGALYSTNPAQEAAQSTDARELQSSRETFMNQFAEAYANGSENFLLTEDIKEAFSAKYSSDFFSGFKYSEDNIPTKNYQLDANFKVISDVDKLDEDFKFKIMLHENTSFNFNDQDKIDTNMLFLSRRSLNSSIFESLIENKINKFESIFDKTLEYLDLQEHEKLLADSVDDSIEKVKTLNDLTTFNKKLEKDLNYGNIVEKFISSGISKHNGKIINILLEKDLNYIKSSSKDDRRLLDKQEIDEDLNISTNTLLEFYEKVMSFKIISEDINNIDQKIPNSDRLVGQLLYDYAISSYNIFPNCDFESQSSLFSSNRLQNDRFDVLNKYPLIRVYNHYNPDVRGVINNTTYIESIQGNEFNTNLCLKNVQKKSVNSRGNTNKNYFNYVEKSLPDVEVMQSNRFSLIGETHIQETTIGLKVVRENFQNQYLTLRVNSNTSDSTRQSLYDNVYFDVKGTENYTYDSPSFMVFPERYLTSEFIDKAIIEDYDDDESFIFNFASSSDNSDGYGVNLGEDGITRNAVANISLAKNSVGSLFGRKVMNIASSSSYIPETIYNNIKEVWNLSLRENITKIYAKNFYDANSSSDLNSTIRLSININNEEIDNHDYNIGVSKFILENHFQNNKELSLLTPDFRDYGGNISNLGFQVFTSGLETITVNNQEIDVFDEESSEFYVKNLNRELFDPIDQNIFSILENRQGINWGGIRNDVVVFKGSNTFFTRKELIEWSNNKVTLSNNPESFKYIIPISNRILNKNNTSEFIKNSAMWTNHSHLTLKIANTINRIKRSKSEIAEELNNMISRGKSHLLENKNFCLLYSEKEQNCINTFKDSKFISEGNSYKNNFTKSFTKNIKNTSESFASNENFDNSHLFTSLQYREFLSKSYFKSFVKDKTTLLKRLTEDCIDIFKNSMNYSDDREVGFDILLAESLSDRNKSDANQVNSVVKMIIANSLAKSSSIDSQISFLYEQPEVIEKDRHLASKSQGYILSQRIEEIFGSENKNNIIRSIFNPKIIKNQNTYVIRKITPPPVEFITRSFSSSIENATTIFQHLPGELITLKFPFVKFKFDMSEAKPCTIKGTLQNLKDYYGAISNGEEISEDDNSASIAKFWLQDIKQLSSTLSYNHDIFLRSEVTGIDFYKENEDSKLELHGFDFDEENEKIGCSLRVGYFDKSTSNLEEPSVNGLGYGTWSEIIPFSYFYLSDIESTFSNKITNLCENFLSIYDINYEDFNTMQDILDWIDTNPFYIKVLKEMLEVFSCIVLDSFNNYEVTVLNQLYRNSNISYSFSNGNISDREKAVSDLEKMQTILEEKTSSVEYIKSLPFRNSTTYYNAYNMGNESFIFNNRLEDLCRTFKVIRNSDISDAICHDLIHGYFLNFEENVLNRQENSESFKRSIEEINKNINSFKEVENFDITNYMLNEFYQNFVSKEIQEIMFYKNIYNETFIKDNTYQNTKTKYLNSNVFNHRRLFLKNKHKLTKSSLRIITDIFRGSNYVNCDIASIPIDFDMSKSLGEEFIVEFSVTPVNLKFPEIEYKELKYFYSSNFTNITSNFISHLGENCIEDYIGYYEDTEKIYDRYCVLDNREALQILNNNIVKRYKISSGFNNSSVVSGFDSEALSLRILNDLKVSHAIKNLNFMRQKAFDEKVKIIGSDIENIISDNTVKLYNSLSLEDFLNVFEEEKNRIFGENSSEYSYFNLSSNQDILENKSLYKKYLIEADKDLSCKEVIEAMIPNKFYDTFNILISKNKLEVVDERSSIERRVRQLSAQAVSESWNFETQRSDIFSDADTEDFFVYYIGAKVL